MSSGLGSSANRQGRVGTSSETYTVNNYDESRTLLPSNKSSKKVRVCTLCGLCKGLRPIPKSSLLSFD